MVIFKSYVKLPEGTKTSHSIHPKKTASSPALQPPLRRRVARQVLGATIVHNDFVAARELAAQRFAEVHHGLHSMDLAAR